MKSPSSHHIQSKKLPQRNVIILLALVILSSFFLILINYFTIKTLSATRAYTSGESYYSKGQKDAARYLIMYINTEDSAFWNLFTEELSVPIGDSLARVALSKKCDTKAVKYGFLAGRNHKNDLDDMIWLYENFHTISFMKNAIQIWKTADVSIGRQYAIALTFNEHLKKHSVTQEEKELTIKQINEITTILTHHERRFSDTLGSAGRTIKSYLFLFNIIMTILIISSSSIYANVMIKRLNGKNLELLRTNQELDKFVYSASHDLRAPITSVKGLIEVARHENDVNQIKQYLNWMNQSLDKQDQFIRDIIDFSKNKRDDILLEEIELEQLIDQALTFNRHILNDKGITIEKDIQVNTIIGDSLRFQIILNNLISNAFKYSDQSKKSYVMIKTHGTEKSLIIEISDNGIGIKNDDLNRIFEMFFVIADNKGAGLGLYVTQQTVLKLRGIINVESQIGIGSKFIVSIPLYYATIM